MSLCGGFLLRASWHTRVRLRLPVFHDSRDADVCDPVFVPNISQRDGIWRQAWKCGRHATVSTTLFSGHSKLACIIGCSSMNNPGVVCYLHNKPYSDYFCWSQRKAPLAAHLHGQSKLCTDMTRIIDQMVWISSSVTQRTAAPYPTILHLQRLQVFNFIRPFHCTQLQTPRSDERARPSDFKVHLN